MWYEHWRNKPLIRQHDNRKQRPPQRNDERLDAFWGKRPSQVNNRIPTARHIACSSTAAVRPYPRDRAQNRITRRPEDFRLTVPTSPAGGITAVLIFAWLLSLCLCGGAGGRTGIWYRLFFTVPCRSENEFRKAGDGKMTYSYSET